MHLGATPLQGCHGCGGLWISVAAFDHICSDRESHSGATGLNLPAPIAAEPQVRYVKCPVCAKLMNRMNYAGGSGIIIDICRPHGIWLDRDELRHIVEFIQAGGLDQRRKKDTEKLQRERAALERERSSSQAMRTGSGGSWGTDSPVADSMVWSVGEVLVALARGMLQR
ncbi:MAG: zf-TFIIB domain-containing protein [Burkholderiales bacterium]|nr:zf-TFIIB domain-containing protein [Phycisphaerae bacterium]